MDAKAASYHGLYLYIVFFTETFPHFFKALFGGRDGAHGAEGGLKFTVVPYPYGQYLIAARVCAGERRPVFYVYRAAAEAAVFRSKRFQRIQHRRLHGQRIQQAVRRELILVGIDLHDHVKQMKQVLALF